MEPHEQTQPNVSSEGINPPVCESFHPYEVYQGSLISIGETIVELNVGFEQICEVERSELKDHEGSEALALGQVFSVFVEPSKQKKDAWVGSLDKASKLALWHQMEKISRNDDIIDGKVVAKTKGGFSVDVGMRAFLPMGQASLHGSFEVENLVEQEIQVHVIRFSPGNAKVVVSRRRLLEAQRKEQGTQTFQRLSEGDTVEGVVVSLVDYGAFVDIGGIDGLLHLQDMSWGRVHKSEDILSLGQRHTVRVLKLDREKEKVSLSLKHLQEDPWIAALDTYLPGSRHRAEVVNFVKYGAFVELESGVEGLIHISELSWTREPRHPSDVLKAGESIEVEVLEIDPQAKRISLSLKRTQQNPWEHFAEANPTGTQLRGKVVSLKDFGLFVEIDKKIQGMVHCSDLSWLERPQPADLYEVGQEIDVVVLKVTPVEGRLALGVKQLTEDPWKALIKTHPLGSTLKGKVTRLVEFGAFIEVEPGIEGLCHVSELAVERVERPAEVAKIGEQLEVKVIGLEASKRKLSLSVKALSQDVGDYKAYAKHLEQSAAHFGDTLGDALAQARKNMGNHDD
jgi:small subunit ribosomal protein S1